MLLIMAWYSVLVFGIIQLILVVNCEDDINKYDDYSLVRLYPKTEEQVRITNAYQVNNHVEVLKDSRGKNDSLDILLAPNQVDDALAYAKNNDLIFELKQKNYGRSFHTDERTPRRRYLRSFHLYGYNSYHAMGEFIDTVQKRHPNLVTLQNLGNSYQGRKMSLVKISSNPGAGNPIIFIDAGIHAREWVAPAMALYLVQRLVGDAEALNNVDWYILPLVNPDGYEFTRSSPANRLWRKTRSKTGHGCFGVDGNRNYGFKWAVSGVSMNPCDKETYAGPRPFSEPETKIVKNIMMENADRMKLYVSLHSYGQYLVYPWGYTGDYLPKTWQKLDAMAHAVSDSVEKAGGRRFKVLSAGKWYPAAGGSDDYAFGAAGVPYSYTMELTDGHEFIYPESQLKTTLPQFYQGFKTFGERIRSEFGRITKSVK